MGNAGVSQGAVLFHQLMPIFLIGLVFYFLILKPQIKKQKDQRQMLEGLKKGDKVITIGGIYGVILELQDNMLKIKVAENLNLKVLKTAVSAVLTEEPTGQRAIENKKK